MAHEVDKPTYRIVGERERMDERDTVFAREYLEEGSPAEVEYHRRRPELIEVDRHIADYIKAKQGAGATEADWRQSAYYSATFGPIAGLGRPDEVDGKVAERRIEWTPEQAATRIKELGRFLGAARVRIGPLDPAWVYTHRGCPPFHDRYGARPPFVSGVPQGYRDLGYGDPIALNHPFAISLVFPQDERLMRTTPSPVADLEVGKVYAQCALASAQLARFIRSIGYQARAHHLRNTGVMLVPVGADAGVGELSRAGYLLARGLGLNFRLACVTTDLPLTLDKPVDLGVQDFCEKCMKCATTCPAGAIPEGPKQVVRGVEKWKVDAEKCLLYWGKTGTACAICQTVCPWSKPENLFHTAVGELAIRVKCSRRMLVWGDDLVYGRKHRRVPAPDWLKG